MPTAVEMQNAMNWYYPAELPVVLLRDQILDALRLHDVLVVVSETGSGKTTQLPKMVTEVLREIYADKMGLIGVTQPRRIAAVSVAKRVAEELQQPLGAFVGYQVRFDEKISTATRIKFMTDGILLAETQGDRMLKRYDAIILDEAHERSLNIDFLLGYLKELRRERPSLKIVISSATLDAGAFADFFREEGKEVPIVQASGRTFPVEEFFLPADEEEELSQHLVRAVDWLSDIDPVGDVLVFLPGEKEIRDCADALEGRKYFRTEILPLFARLSMGDQQRVFSPGDLRRVILATNVAETSLTIPRITSVVDSGLARVSRWSPARGVQRLQIEPVSQASARQRKGRCGRVKEGICVRLYDEDDLLDRAEFTDPEIRRSSLAGVILRMIALGLPPIEEFPLIDAPAPKAVSEGYRTLREVGALGKDKQLTVAGRQMARMPVDPRLARMLIEASHEKCLRELLPVISSLESSDPRERPADKQKEADAAHARWKHGQSDFFSLLRLWLDLQRFQENGKWRRNALRKYCHEAYLNMRRVMEWANIHEELLDLCQRELKWEVPAPMVKPDSSDAEWQSAYDPFHRSLLAGVPRQFALWDVQEKIYRSAGGGAFAVFPGSGLFAGKRFDWVLGMEIVETTRLWARRLARIDPAWVEKVASHLCTYRYSHGYWDDKQGAVYAKETVLCGGLVVVKDRPVHWGRIDPAAAREVFIREGLLGGGIRSACPALQHLQALREQVRLMEVKLRRPDYLWSDEQTFAFFDKHIPAGMCTAKAFHKWRMDHETSLMAELRDVVWDEKLLEDMSAFPDSLMWRDEEYSVYYAMAPGERDDGVTIGVHIDQLKDFPEHLLSWGVPGYLPDRVEFLVRSLPKELRKACQPISEFVREFVEDYENVTPDVSLVTALVQRVQQRVRYHVPESDIDLSALPPEWQVKCWVCDDEGHELLLGLNPLSIKEKLRPLLLKRLEEHANEEWQCTGSSEWPMDLPEFVAGNGGQAYPALVDEGKTVGVRAFHDAEQARQSHRAGCVRLLMIHQSDQVTYLTKKFPIGLAARVELPRVGFGGTKLETLIALSAEGALGQSLPRTADDYAQRAKQARGDWHVAAVPVGQALDAIVSLVPELRSWCEQQRASKFLAEVADDILDCLDWLLRKDFAWRAGHAVLCDYPRHLQALQQRLDRLKSLPIQKDLEKMDRVLSLWNPWFSAWRKDPDRADLWALGWMLMELRISIFAPNIPVRFSVSEKKIRLDLERCIHSGLSS
ncbi:MAG: ATP-dependent helicase HrpA [Verrucomicrobiota bacterium]|jgi:ATP-dependent helicase HrpA